MYRNELEEAETKRELEHQREVTNEVNDLSPFCSPRNGPVDDSPVIMFEDCVMIPDSPPALQSNML